jgi:hypothetical protein
MPEVSDDYAQQPETYILGAMLRLLQPLAVIAGVPFENDFLLDKSISCD